MTRRPPGRATSRRSARPAPRLAAMSRYAAFLRAINIGGRRVTGQDLLACFEAMGFDDAAVFQASGNVVFSANRESPTKLAARIDGGLTASLGYEVVTFLRTDEEVRAMADQRPFPDKIVNASKGKLQLALLTKRPALRARDAVLAMATDQDRLAFNERELYWLPSGGFAESDLDRNRLAKVLGPMTFRTKGTIERIARKYFET